MSVDERLTDDEIQTLKKLAQEAQKDGFNRRELMQAAGMTGLGALLGGGSTAALVGSASASASTSDSDGNVGLPSNRVDVFADGVDSNSLSTDQAHTRSRAATVVVHKTGGTVYADGPSGEIASGTNSATVIQAALDNIQAGGLLFIQAGTYLIDTTLELKGPITFRGAGFGESSGSGSGVEKQTGTTLYQADGANLDAVIDYSGADDYFYGHFADFKVHGNKANQTGGEGHGIVATGSGTYERWFSRIFVKRCGGKGIRNIGWPCTLDTVVVESCDEQGLQIGSAAVQLYGSHIQSNGWSGVLLDSVDALYIGGGKFHRNGDHGIKTFDCENAVIHGAEFTENNQGGSVGDSAGIQFTSGFTIADNKITNCLFDGGSNATQTYGVNIQTGDDIHLTENTFKNHATGAVNDAGTRTRWNGVIAGGPLGGTDISAISTTAIRTGMEAIGDGTTKTAGKKYRWDGAAWSPLSPPASGATDWSDVSASRALGTEYQNTTGNLLEVVVQVNVSASGDNANMGLLTGNASGVTFSSNLTDYMNINADSGGDLLALSGRVPDGGYYEVRAFGLNAASIDQWNERELTH